MDGRSLATIGRPDAMYSNSFNGDVNRVEIVDAGFGSTTTSARLQATPRVTRQEQTREGDALGTVKPIGKAAQPREVRLARMSADDEPSRIRQRGNGLDDEIDSLPRIEVTGIGDGEPRRGICAVCGRVVCDVRVVCG